MEKLCSVFTLNSFTLPSEQDPWKSAALSGVCPQPWPAPCKYSSTNFTLSYLSALPREQTNQSPPPPPLFSFGFLPSCPSQTHTHLPALSPSDSASSQLLYFYWCGRHTVKQQGLHRVDLCYSWQFCRVDPCRSVVAVMQSQVLKLPWLSWYHIQLFITWHLQQPT